MRRFLPSILISLAFLAAACLAAVVVARIGSSMFGDWRLVFHQFHSQGRFWLLAAVCTLAVGCIVALFQYEQQLISRRLGLTLLGLRLSLVLVLFLTLLEPVWTWSYDERITGRVVVAVDVSESMDTRDTHARDAEKLRWARAIGQLGDRDDRYRRWLEAFEQGEKPQWSTAEEERDPVRRERTARAREANVRELLSDVGRFSRLQLAIRTLLLEPESLLDRLSREARTDVALFAGDYAAADRQALSELVAGGELSLNRQGTDLLQPLSAALSGSDESRLAGVVILSDGRDTSERDQNRFVSRITGLGVPVHTVLVGSEHRPRDLSISHVDAPTSVFKDDKPLVRAVLHSPGFESEELTVYLERLDDPEREPLAETVTTSARPSEVSFSLEGLEVGRHRFRVRTDVLPDETRADNNSRDFSISVVDDRAQVLLLEGEGRWEFRFINNALERDERVQVDNVLFDQPFLGVLRRPFFPRAIDELNPDDPQESPFSRYDAVVVGDVSPRDLPVRQWRLLERFVREEGGTLVLTAGKRFLPRAYRGTSVETLLPIENLRTIDLADDSQTGAPLQRGFHLSITPDGEHLPMFRLAGTAAESKRIWSELPGHPWGIVGEAKGGASVWAAALEPGRRPSLELERESGLIVQHYVGTGQVVWIGLDSTWRWRFRVGDTHHHRFWGQLVRWAVSFKATAGNENVRLGLRESVIEEGAPATIQARWNERFHSQHRNLKATAIVEAEEGEFTQKVPLSPQNGRASQYEGQALGLKPGEYRVRLEVEGDLLGEKPPEASLTVNARLSRELQDVSTNRALLEEIARASGGTFLLLDELERLPELFQNVSRTTSIREEVPLWSHWLVLALFCTFGTAEWILRKLNGLP